MLRGYRISDPGLGKLAIDGNAGNQQGAPSPPRGCQYICWWSILRGLDDENAERHDLQHHIHEDAATILVDLRNIKWSIKSQACLHHGKEPSRRTLAKQARRDPKFLQYICRPAWLIMTLVMLELVMQYFAANVVFVGSHRPQCTHVMQCRAMPPRICHMPYGPDTSVLS